MSLGSVLILGLGASGLAAARYCSGLIGDAVVALTVADSGDSPVLRDRAELVARSGAVVLLGTDAITGSFDLCIASPGIPPHAPLMLSARAASREVVSEIEFAFRRSGSPWVAVTGTNGKTTTTALITHLLNCGGLPARAVGNFGPPAVEAVAEASSGEILVAEVSSFQLALTQLFHPRVAVLLNITPDHVDWHGSLDKYAADKARIFANLDSDDMAVIDMDDAAAASHADPLLERGVPVARVSRHRAFGGGASVRDGILTLDTTRGPVELLAADELNIIGAHNISNALAAASAASALGVSADALREGLSSFAPIEHRIEPVGSVGGVEWFNDSKATNPDAVGKALEAFSDRSLVVLLGGRNKGSDFCDLASQTAATARLAIVFGESRDEIAEAFSGTALVPVVADTLADAVAIAARQAEAGDAVVLSPGCASFDEFENYEQRGRVFKSLVRALGLNEQVQP